MVGQAVGIAAGLCAKKGCDPRQIDAHEVRRLVTERGGKIDV
jgi:hypothetical protein